MLSACLGLFLFGILFAATRDDAAPAAPAVAPAPASPRRVVVEAVAEEKGTPVKKAAAKPRKSTPGPGRKASPAPRKVSKSPARKASKSPARRKSPLKKA